MPKYWRDRRTGIILASGAKQNWPTTEDDLINRLYLELRTQRRLNLSLNVVEYYSNSKFVFKYIEHLKKPIIKYYNGTELMRIEEITYDGYPFNGYGNVFEGDVCFWGKFNPFHNVVIKAFEEEGA